MIMRSMTLAMLVVALTACATVQPPPPAPPPVAENLRALDPAVRESFGAYLGRLHARIHPAFAQEWGGYVDRLPKGHPHLNGNLDGEVDLAITKDTGQIASVNVKSSGLPAFDAAMLLAVQGSAPYGRAPEGIASPDGNVHVRWRFHRDPVDACAVGDASPYFAKAASAPRPEPAPFDLAALVPMPWDELLQRVAYLRLGVVLWDSDHPRTMEAACERGFMTACDDLADALYAGKGVPQDKTRAVLLYRKACVEGVTSACESLPAARARAATGARRQAAEGAGAKEAGAIRKRCVDGGDMKSCEQCSDFDAYPDYQYACLYTWCGKTNDQEACASLRAFLRHGGPR
jgi:hypothetical protein